jgi:hypothetical protein
LIGQLSFAQEKQRAPAAKPVIEKSVEGEKKLRSEIKKKQLEPVPIRLDTAAPPPHDSISATTEKRVKKIARKKRSGIK